MLKEAGRPASGQPAGALRAEPVPVSGKAAHQAQDWRESLVPLAIFILTIVAVGLFGGL